MSSHRLLATAAIVAAVGTLAACGPNDPSSGKASSSSAPTTAKPTGTSTSTTNPTAGPAKPMYPGWQTQSRATHYIQYDVPPATDHWEVRSQDEITAYQGADGKPIVAMSGTADYWPGGCASTLSPNTVIGQAGKGQLATIGAQGGDTAAGLATNATNAAGNWGFEAYGGKDHKPKLSFSKPAPWDHNGLKGYTVTATVTGIYRPSPCVPASAVARSIAYTAKDGTIHEWVIYADQGVPHALTTAEIDKIMTTVRPSPDGSH